MQQDFERFGFVYMPRTGTGCGCLLAFILSTIAFGFLVESIWVAMGWRGSEMAQGVVSLIGIAAMLRFAHSRSK